MTRGRYKADNSMKGMGGFILHDTKLQAAITRVAELGVEHAESIAPVGRTGVYSESFTVTPERTDLKRAGAMIVNDAPHAPLVEFERTHTLAKTADYLKVKR